MLWFPHDNDAHLHPKIKKLKRVFSYMGPWIYWCTFEIIAKYGDKTLKMPLKKYDIISISDDIGVSKEDLLRVWEEMMEMDSLSKRWFNKGYLYSKKLRERPDNYTKRVWRESRQGMDKVRTNSAIQYNTIHNNTIHNKDLDFYKKKNEEFKSKNKEVLK